MGRQQKSYIDSILREGEGINETLSSDLIILSDLVTSLIQENQDLKSKNKNLADAKQILEEKVVKLENEIGAVKDELITVQNIIEPAVRQNAELDLSQELAELKITKLESNMITNTAAISDLQEIAKVEFNDLNSEVRLLKENFSGLSSNIQGSTIESSKVVKSETLEHPAVLNCTTSPGQFFAGLGSLTIVALGFGIVPTVIAFLGCRMVLSSRPTYPWKTWGYGLLGVTVAASL